MNHRVHQVPVREPEGFQRDRATGYHRGHATNRFRLRAVVFGLLLGLNALQIQRSLEDCVSETFVYHRRTEILQAFQGNGPVAVEDLLPKDVLGRPDPGGQAVGPMVVPGVRASGTDRLPKYQARRITGSPERTYECILVVLLLLWIGMMEVYEFATF